MDIETLTLGEVQQVAHALARELMTWDEPIPEFGTRYPHKLESCISVPFQTFRGKDPHPTLIDKAAILFYLMNKNHPFQNGNKRIAVTTLLTFLVKNNKWIQVDNQELYNFAKWVAESNPRLREPTLDAIKQFIGLYITKPPNVLRKGKS